MARATRAHRFFLVFTCFAALRGAVAVAVAGAGAGAASAAQAADGRRSVEEPARRDARRKGVPLVRAELREAHSEAAVPQRHRTSSTLAIESDGSILTSEASEPPPRRGAAAPVIHASSSSAASPAVAPSASTIVASPSRATGGLMRQLVSSDAQGLGGATTDNDEMMHAKATASANTRVPGPWQLAASDSSPLLSWTVMVLLGIACFVGVFFANLIHVMATIHTAVRSHFSAKKSSDFEDSSRSCLDEFEKMVQHRLLHQQDLSGLTGACCPSRMQGALVLKTAAARFSSPDPSATSIATASASSNPALRSPQQRPALPRGCDLQVFTSLPTADGTSESSEANMSARLYKWCDAAEVAKLDLDGPLGAAGEAGHLLRGTRALPSVAARQQDVLALLGRFGVELPNSGTNGNAAMADILHSLAQLEGGFAVRDDGSKLFFLTESVHLFLEDGEHVLMEEITTANGKPSMIDGVPQGTKLLGESAPVAARSVWESVFGGSSAGITFVEAALREKEISKIGNFGRVHRSYIVNIVMAKERQAELCLTAGHGDVQAMDSTKTYCWIPMAQVPGAQLRRLSAAHRGADEAGAPSESSSAAKMGGDVSGNSSWSTEEFRGASLFDCERDYDAADGPRRLIDLVLLRLVNAETQRRLAEVGQREPNGSLRWCARLPHLRRKCRESVDEAARRLVFECLQFDRQAISFDGCTREYTEMVQEPQSWPELRTVYRCFIVDAKVLDA